MPIIFRIAISSFPRVRLGLNFEKDYTPHPSETSIVFSIHWYGIFECAFVRAGMQRLSPVSISVQNLNHIEIIKTFTFCYDRQRFDSPNVLALQNISKQLPLRTAGAYTDR